MSYPGDKGRECPDCGDKIHAKAVSCACGWREKPRARSTTPEFDTQCSHYSDRGYRCNKPGCVSEGTNGSGPWWCSDHYWIDRRGAQPENLNVPRETYRQRWYRERGLPYQDPKVGNAKQVAPAQMSDKEAA